MGETSVSNGFVKWSESSDIVWNTWITQLDGHCDSCTWKKQSAPYCKDMQYRYPTLQIQIVDGKIRITTNL